MSRHRFAVPEDARGRGLSPAAKHIYHYLTAPCIEERSVSELAEELFLDPATVRRNCNTLLEEGLIEKRYTHDARTRVYGVDENPYTDCR